MKYILHTGNWEGDVHEQAWLIRVTINASKDILKSFYRKNVHSLEEVDQQFLTVREADRGLLDAVLHLPPKYRDVVYLHYYEGYKATEIATILGKKENTIYSWLARARERLKNQLGGEPDEE